MRKMTRRSKRSIKVFVLSIVSLSFASQFLPATLVSASDIDSTNYTLLAPAIGAPISGSEDSTNYSLLQNSTIDSFVSSSSLFTQKGGFLGRIEANVPLLSCLEVDTNTGNTVCTGVPGSDGMQGVCGKEGCYDRAKAEIDAQGNPDDVRYALQVSTRSDFSSNIYYVDATLRTLSPTLGIDDFVPKCEWEGTVLSGICASANTTWQKYNILGLNGATAYYIRSSALHGTDTNGTFTQSAWGTSSTITTKVPTLSLDIDIAPDTTTPTNPPHNIGMGTLTPGSVITSTNMIVLRVSSNALNGVTSQIKSLNGGLKNDAGSELITSLNGDLALNNYGFGLRNDDTTNSAVDTGTLGDIVVATTPYDFSDTGAVTKVGSPVSSFSDIFDSNSLPLNTGISGYFLKAKSDISYPAGTYSDTLTFIVVGSF